MSNETEIEIQKVFDSNLSRHDEKRAIAEMVDTKAKEAVKEFAEELIGSGAMYYGQVPDVSVNEIKHLAKQKGVEI